MVDAQKYDRHSIRLKDYDYTQTGGYAVTICVQNKECRFGHIEDSEMYMNAAGLMVEKWWLRMAENYENIVLDEYRVMPNHFHGIIFIMDVGADQSVRPPYKQEEKTANLQEGKHVGLPLQIQWFKTMTTNEYIRGVNESRWPTFIKRFWQRNYYEHVIRDERDLNRIREYIVNNPLKWELDRYFRL